MSSREGQCKGFVRLYSYAARYVFLLMWAVSRINTEAEEFQVSGTLSGDRVFENKVTGSIPNTHFTVTVSDCNWLIHIEPGLAGGYVEAGYDGDVIRIVSGGTGYAPTASLINSKVPLSGADTRLAILWMAFAQSCYLHESMGSGQLIPAYNRTFFRKPIPAFVEGFSSEQPFPSLITYLSDGTHLNHNGETVRYKPPFQNGFTNAIYTVVSFTNIESLKLPLEFKFNEFQPSAIQPASSNDISVCFRCSGKVLSVNPHSTLASFSPQLPTNEPAAVRDLRFLTPDRGYEALSYTTNIWLSTNDVKQMARFETYTQQEAIAAKQGNLVINREKLAGVGPVEHSARPVVLFVIFTTVAFVIIITVSIVGKKNKTENS